MSARNEIDYKNIQEINNITDRYPNILKKYINSLSRKTTYTKLAYCRYICRFMRYMNDELKYNMRRESNYNKIKPMDIDQYMESIKMDENGNEKSPMYRAAQLAALKGFFKFLYDNEIINKNPCINTEVPKETKIHDIITIDENDLKIMMDNIEKGVGNTKSRATQSKWKSRDKALLILGITTGLRISAICGIDIEDIDFNNKTIKVTEKGNKEKYIYLGNNTLKVLARWIIDRNKMNINDTKALFVCQSGKRISVDTVQRRFKQISEGTGKTITPHKMRATCATKLYEKTGDIYLVQQQLGHKNIENTKRYAKISESKMREAATILDSIC